MPLSIKIQSAEIRTLTLRKKLKVVDLTCHFNLTKMIVELELHGKYKSEVLFSLSFLHSTRNKKGKRFNFNFRNCQAKKPYRPNSKYSLLLLAGNF